jgi:hypothetical protein
MIFLYKCDTHVSHCSVRCSVIWISWFVLPTNTRVFLQSPEWRPCCRQVGGCAAVKSSPYDIYVFPFHVNELSRLIVLAIYAIESC